MAAALALGGRIIERERDGKEHEWGKVLDWDAPAMVRFTWYPGDTPDHATEVEVRFTAEGEGSRLDLVYSKWEQLGDKARLARRGYPIGWAYVLSIYAGRAGTAGRDAGYDWEGLNDDWEAAGKTINDKR